MNGFIIKPGDDIPPTAVALEDADEDRWYRETPGSDLWVCPMMGAHVGPLEGWRLVNRYGPLTIVESI